jgi:hypothetical protein
LYFFTRKIFMVIFYKLNVMHATHSMKIHCHLSMPPWQFHKITRFLSYAFQNTPIFI